VNQFLWSHGVKTSEMQYDDKAMDRWKIYDREENSKEDERVYFTMRVLDDHVLRLSSRSISVSGTTE